MLPVVDKPVIQYAVEEAREAGIEQFVFITGRGKHVIEDHFDHAYELKSLLEARDKTAELQGLLELLPPTGSVGFIRQQKPLGLGHAVWCARHFVGNEPFAVLLPDDLMVGELLGAASPAVSRGGERISNDSRRSVAILVPCYKRAKNLCDSLMAGSVPFVPQRALQPYLVSVRKEALRQMNDRGFVQEHESGVWLLLNRSIYSANKGLDPASSRLDKSLWGV